MGLFGLKKKKKVFTLSDEPLDRLTPDGELPYGWIYAHKDFTDKISSEYKHFLQKWLDSRHSTALNECAALISFVTYMNDVRELCKSKGECYDRWREVLFDDEYLLRQSERLQQLKNKLNSK